MTLCLTLVDLFLSFLFILSRSSSIPYSADIQFNIWHHLTFEERLRLRGLSTFTHNIHHLLFPAECLVITQCLNLSKQIHRLDPHVLVSFFLCNQQFQYLESNILKLNLGVIQDRNGMFIEKIMVDIMETADSFVSASRACVLWLKSFQLRIPDFEHDLLPHDRWPTVDINGSVIPSHHNLEKMHRVFIKGKAEMVRTASKYNRYTRFAFKFMDSILESLDAITPNTTEHDDTMHTVVSFIWVKLVSVEVIEDYLMRPQLRDYPHSCINAMDLLMNDAVQSNGSLDSNRLRLMMSHPRILFDFELIIAKFAGCGQWNEETGKQFLDYVVKHELMTWKAIRDQLAEFDLFGLDPQSLVIQSMGRYAYRQRIREKYRIKIKTMSVKQTEPKFQGQNVSLRKLGRIKGTCCVCM